MPNLHDEQLYLDIASSFLSSISGKCYEIYLRLYAQLTFVFGVGKRLKLYAQYPRSGGSSGFTKW